MKRTIIIGVAISIAFSLNVVAQENHNEFTTMFGKDGGKKIEHGGYGSFGFGYSSINGKDALLANFKGAWIINHNFGLGIAGTSFINNLDKNISTGDYYLTGGYGGLFLQPIVLPKLPMHISFPIVIGAGGATVLPNNFWNETNYEIKEYDVFFVFEPGVELEFNVVKFFRISMGATYRFTNGVLLNNPDNQPVDLGALDGITYNINFKFGKF